MSQYMLWIKSLGHNELNQAKDSQKQWVNETLKQQPPCA